MIPLGILASAVVGSADPLAPFPWQWRFESDSITGVSDGGTVATWPDTSGNGRDATQVTESWKPTFDVDAFGAQPGVLYGSNTDQRLVTAAITGLAQPTTIFVVATARPGSEAANLFDGIATDARHTAWASDASYGYAGATGNLNASPTWLAAAGIFVFRYNGASSRVWRNDGVASPVVDFGGDTLTGLTIGNRFSSNDSAGRAIGAILAVNASLSTADMNTVGAYLADKYGYSWTDIT